MRDADVLVFTETWLSQNVTNERVSLEGFQQLRNDRSDGKGGVCMYVSDQMTCEPLNIATDLEQVSAIITDQEHQPVLVTGIYRSPKLPLNQFLPRLEDLLFMLLEHGISNIIIVGDFNEDLLNNNRHPVCLTFNTYGFVQTVHKSTTCYGSLLDHVYVKTQHFEHDSKVVPTYYSDHEATKIVLKCTCE